MKFSLDLQYMGNDLLVIKGEGQFDTFYCPAFISKVQDVADHISPRMVGYDFSRVPFINATALGAVIRAGEILEMSSPPIQNFLINPTSHFVQDTMAKIGILGRVVPYKTIPEALEELVSKV